MDAQDGKCLVLFPNKDSASIKLLFFAIKFLEKSEISLKRDAVVQVLFRFIPVFFQ